MRPAELVFTIILGLAFGGGMAWLTIGMIEQREEETLYEEGQDYQLSDLELRVRQLEQEEN